MAVFVVDCRHPETSTLDRLDEEMRRLILSIAQADGLEVEIERTIDALPGLVTTTWTWSAAPATTR